MFKSIQRAFSKLYPVAPKATWTVQGASLRRALGIALILHCVFFVVALALVGFRPMLFELALMALSYSCYLHLREWLVVAYLALLGLAIIYGVF